MHFIFKDNAAPTGLDNLFNYVVTKISLLRSLSVIGNDMITSVEILLHYLLPSIVSPIGAL